MTDTTTDPGADDVLVVRTGVLRPEITKPTVIGAVVRLPVGHELADAIDLARTAIAPSDSTECVRVVVGAPGEIAAEL